MNSDRKIAKMICEVGRRLYKSGMVASNDGNISCRISKGRFMVTPTCVSKGFMRPKDLCILDKDGNYLKGGKPTSEAKMHVMILKARPDINSCVHAHPRYATAFTVTSTPFDPTVLPEAMLGLSAVRTAPYAAPSTLELAKNAADAALTTDVVLLSRHGAITLGCDPIDALYKLESLEHCAHTLIYAKLLGKSTELDPNEQEQLLTISKEVYH